MVIFYPTDKVLPLYRRYLGTKPGGELNFGVSGVSKVLKRAEAVF
jgi:hypothetical protein